MYGYERFIRAARWLFVVASFGCIQAQAASFDCSKAKTQVEKLICADTGLSSQDEALAKRFAEVARVRGINKAFLKADQRAWLKQRNTCADAKREDRAKTPDAKCVSIWYESRLRQLSPGRYRMTSGKGYSVCEAYKRTLDNLGELPGPLACPNDFLDKTPGISRPDWREIPLDFDLYLKLEVFQARDSHRVVWDYDPANAEKPFNQDKHPEFVRKFKEIVERNRFRMFVVELDSDADGRTETVLRLQWEGINGCHLSGLFFVNPQLTDLDETPYLNLYGTPNTYGAPVTHLTDIVLFMGKAYFFQAGTAPLDFFFLRDQFSGRFSICSFEFNPSHQGGLK